MVSCQKGPTRHAYAWQIGPIWQETLNMRITTLSGLNNHMNNEMFKSK